MRDSLDSSNRCHIGGLRRVCSTRSDLKQTFWLVMGSVEFLTKSRTHFTQLVSTMSLKSLWVNCGSWSYFADGKKKRIFEKSAKLVGKKTAVRGREVSLVSQDKSAGSRILLLLKRTETS